MSRNLQTPQLAYSHVLSAEARSERSHLFDELTAKSPEALTQGFFAPQGLKDGPLIWPASEPDTCDEAADETCADTSSGGEECDEQLPRCLVRASAKWRPSSAGAFTQTACPSLPSTPPPPEAPTQREAECARLPEGGLVDLEESEGRKRGSELMMMLGAAAPAKAPPPPPPPPRPVGARRARGPLLPTAAPFEPRSATKTRAMLATAAPFEPRSAATETRALLATAAPFEPRSATETRGVQPPARGAAERTCAAVCQQRRPSPVRGVQATQQATAKVLESSSRMYLGIVREAALKAFGDDMAHVEGDLSDGFNVQLSERSRHCSAMERLEELGRELWPRLPWDSVAALKPGSIGKRAWLTMHYVLAAPPDNCWDYANTGCCPRGQLCRWPHALPQNLTVDIEVAR